MAIDEWHQPQDWFPICPSTARLDGFFCCFFFPEILQKGEPKQEEALFSLFIYPQVVAGEKTGITAEKSTPQEKKSPADGGDVPGQQEIFFFFSLLSKTANMTTKKKKVKQK